MCDGATHLSRTRWWAQTPSQRNHYLLARIPARVRKRSPNLLFGPWRCVPAGVGGGDVDVNLCSVSTVTHTDVNTHAHTRAHAIARSLPCSRTSAQTARMDTHLAAESRWHSVIPRSLRWPTGAGAASVFGFKYALVDRHANQQGKA